jgi:hypothetical protein
MTSAPVLDIPWLDADRPHAIVARRSGPERHGMSPVEIEEHVAVAKALAEEPGP